MHLYLYNILNLIKNYDSLKRKLEIKNNYLN